MSARPLRVGIDGRVLAIPAMRGWTRYAGNLLRALEARDDVELIIFAREAPCAAHLVGIRSPVVCVEATRETVWNDWALPRRLRAERVDVFHALADRGLPALKPCPFVVTLHNSFERAHWRSLYPTAKRRAWYWKHELLNANRADAVVTVSDVTRDELVNARVCAAAKLERVYLAPAPEFGPDAAPGDVPVRARHGITAPYVLFVGGYDPHKNVDGLVRAFDRSGLGDHQLVLAAQPSPDLDAMRTAWSALGCAARLRLVAPAPAELPALFRGAEFLVHPSRWESFALPLVEAMVTGTPVVAASAGAMPEILGDAGIYFDPDSVDELAATIRTLATDPERRAMLRDRGVARAALFSWERTAAETVRVYRKVVGQ